VSTTRRGYRAASDWGYRHWVRESQSFMAHRPRWRIAVLATLKWPAFDRKQRRDNLEMRRDRAG